MCGIVGAIADRNVAPILLEGLKRLEYRGYDSAGLAVCSENSHHIHQVRCVGNVKKLIEVVDTDPIAGHLGIAHTRWATHGKPTEKNAHPHMSGSRMAIVHNGIIENYLELKTTLEKKGYIFSSETDTEVVAHSIHSALQQSESLLEAVKATVALLQGAYALAVIFLDAPDSMIVVRKGSPLVIGVGIGENFIASDQLALLPVTNRFIVLEEGDIAQIKKEKVTVYDVHNKKVVRNVKEFEVKYDASEKGPYRHFMIKEIYEQPRAINATLEGRVSDVAVLSEGFDPGLLDLLGRTKLVQIIACGTSYHAGVVAKYWFESIAGVACNVEIASEFRYRKNVILPGTLFITVSQSGETADTLAALRSSKEKGYVGSVAICNVSGSSLVHESDASIMTKAGPEIGVASTKAFTTQLVALFLLVLLLGRYKGIDQEREKSFVKILRALPSDIEKVLSLDAAIEQLAEAFGDKHHALFLGRGYLYPIAMEGALKLKEISYIHAEAYAAGELKHGPLALVDSDMPVITIAPNDDLIGKLKSNMQEVKARGGQLYVFADKEAGVHNEEQVQVLEVPVYSEVLAPIIYTIPLQLLSYHVALLKGTDVDQPRNLAKSVTVE